MAGYVSPKKIYPSVDQESYPSIHVFFINAFPRKLCKRTGVCWSTSRRLSQVLKQVPDSCVSVFSCVPTGLRPRMTARRSLCSCYPFSRCSGLCPAVPESSGVLVLVIQHEGISMSRACRALGSRACVPTTGCRISMPSIFPPKARLSLQVWVFVTKSIW